MGVFDYVLAGILAVFQGPLLFEGLGFGIPAAPLMLFFGFFVGIAVGATPGLAGPMAMAISLPILISIFGVRPEALLPVFGFLIGVMKGATIGGAVPAILFNISGTPDAMMTALDGYPLARKGQARRALRIAHVSSASGDTLSDIVLFVCAPFLAVLVERFLDLPEKTALIILSLAFVAAIMGDSVGKGLISVALGLLAAFVASGEDFYPRLTFGLDALSGGFPLTAVVLGVLIVGEIFASIEHMWWNGPEPPAKVEDTSKRGGLRPGDVRRIAPYAFRSAVLGTTIGALPGVGSTLAATLGYAFGHQRYKMRKAPGDPQFGDGAPEGIAATEAANSAVSGANLIPVLSLGIPGNAAAVFIVLAADSIGGFNPGPSVFKFTSPEVNPELVVAFGIFTLMALGNLLNWTAGWYVMRAMGIMSRVNRHVLMPIVLLVTLTAIYVQETNLGALWIIVGFGVLGYVFRKVGIAVLPFVIAYILAGALERAARQAFSASGADPFFLFSSPVSIVLIVAAVAVVTLLSREAKLSVGHRHASTVDQR